jgi:hypothetical protein
MRPSRIHPPAQRRPGRGASRRTPTPALRTAPELCRQGAASRPFTLWLAANPTSRSWTPAVSVTSAARGGPRAPVGATTPHSHKWLPLVSIRDYFISLLNLILTHFILCPGGPKRTTGRERTTDRERTTARSVAGALNRTGVWSLADQLASPGSVPPFPDFAGQLTLTMVNCMPACPVGH